MKLSRLWTFGIGFVVAATLAAPLRAAPAKAPPSPVAPAITAILDEYQKAMKENKGEGLRTKSDYFSQNKPSPEVTPEVILAALEKPQGPDPRADAYVKWQLLSGIDGKIPAPLKTRALQAYRNAPVPVNHPGIDHTALQAALTRMGPTKADLETPINDELRGVIEKYRVAVVPFMAYRDEFYSRFDPAYDVFAAAFFDIYTRVSHGGSGDEMWKKMSVVIRKWAIDANPPQQQLQALSADLAQLKKLVSDGKYKPYYRVMWLKDGNANALKWQGEGVIGDLDKMSDIGDWLGERAKVAGASGPAGATTGSDTKMTK